ncbi:acyl-CoA N-acyltransferase [Fimicolochytrium jonesii]|uniref:acyl-CoA N-acyltransferase n=1 Tax=Fimicolochytrium jonesii TaxID=1396493 RepID=UPI0022FF0516|nr:acyl-CoA N-acyltransferase [Fimicolochytrium jonesii]KAI8825120.1 acyl-CoA N-acyltransferase [Fimicolochytrium jonesii]
MQQHQAHNIGEKRLPTSVSTDAEPASASSQTCLHPIPPKPAPGTLIFTKFMPGLNETFTIRVADPSTDIPMLTRWHSDPRVSEFWKEGGDENHHRQYLNKVLSSKHSIPCIAAFDGVPFMYLEVYWAAYDLFGRYYPAEPYDRGVHLLVGETKYRGVDRVQAWIEAIPEFIFSDCCETQRLVMEPSLTHGKLIGLLCTAGVSFVRAVRLPHKTAAFLMLRRTDPLFIRGKVRAKGKGGIAVSSKL